MTGESAHLSRRAALGIAATMALAAAAGCSAPSATPAARSSDTSGATPATSDSAAAFAASLRDIERRHGRRVGVYVHTGSAGTSFGYRSAERFAMCSTWKGLGVGAALYAVPDLTQRVTWSRADLVDYSPVTEQHVGTGLTLAELCRAAIVVSDNTAANLVLRRVGGPAAVTAFVRHRLRDPVTRLDRPEPEVNTAIPGDPRDTSTPVALAASYAALAAGPALPADRRATLNAWLRANTTGDQQIRAVVPAGWSVGDKTGHGDYGSTNDVAVLTPPGRAPITLAVLTDDATAPHGDADYGAIRDAARAALARLG